jgi:Nucleotide modification associated domain 2
LADRLGDCIYDYGAGSPPYQRAGVHGPQNRDIDLSGENVLLSWDFYYFGSRAIALPRELMAICHQGQGHKSDANDAYIASFVHWLRGLALSGGQVYGWPDTIIEWSQDRAQRGCRPRVADTDC